MEVVLKKGGGPLQEGVPQEAQRNSVAQYVWRMHFVLLSSSAFSSTCSTILQGLDQVPVIASDLKIVQLKKKKTLKIRKHR